MIPLVSPTITGRDRGYMRQRIADNLLEDDSEVRRFEEAFAERVGCKGAVAVCSGTAAISLALDVLKPEHGIVDVPTYTCVAVRNAAHRYVISYLDSNFDVRNARMRVNRDASADLTILTHMFGRSTFLWEGVAIEDYTLSLGGIPTFTGPLGVCSTHASKMISTGQGGVVFSNDLDLLAEVRRLGHYWEPVSVTDYENFRTGNLSSSLRMSATQAALGVSQLQQLDAFIERRRTLAWRYSDAFEPAGIECPDADCGSVFFRYMIGVDNPAGKVARLAERGIEAGRGVYPPLHRLAGLPDDNYPGATACVNRLLSVPCHPSITNKEAAYIAEQVVQVCAPC